MGGIYQRWSKLLKSSQVRMRSIKGKRERKRGKKILDFYRHQQQQTPFKCPIIFLKTLKSKDWSLTIDKKKKLYCCRRNECGKILKKQKKSIYFVLYNFKYKKRWQNEEIDKKFIYLFLLKWEKQQQRALTPVTEIPCR